MKAKWPNTIPMPGPEEFITGLYKYGGKCCSLGWIVSSFGKCYSGIGSEFRSKMESIAKCRSIGLAHWNDYMSTPEQRAKVWRKTAEHFGYVVENKPWRARK